MSGTPLGDDFQAVDALCSRAWERAGEDLDEFQHDWLARFTDRLARYGAATLLSEREREVLRAIARNIGEEIEL